MLDVAERLTMRGEGATAELWAGLSVFHWSGETTGRQKRKSGLKTASQLVSGFRGIRAPYWKNSQVSGDKQPGFSWKCRSLQASAGHVWASQCGFHFAGGPKANRRSAQVNPLLPRFEPSLENGIPLKPAPGQIDSIFSISYLFPWTLLPAFFLKAWVMLMKCNG